jgi:selenocysteine lyase/cysteine desulfurase
MSFEKLRKHFPVVNHCLYANTAAIGLMSDDLLEWRQEHDLDFLIGGSEMKMESFQMIADTKNTVGQFLGCERERVALVPNFSLALNMLLEGLPKKNRVLLLGSDYPSVNWPFENRGFPLSYARLDHRVEEQILACLEKEDIDVFAFSLVQWQTGIKISPGFIKHLRGKFPDLLMIADGTQFCGAFDFNFDQSGLDVLGGSGYKWLLAGTGNGFMLFSERAAKRISPKTTGFNAVNGRLDHQGPIRLAKQMEPGHLDSLCFGSLDFAIKKLMSLGIENIEAHNRSLLKKAMEGFGSLGLLGDDITNRPDHGTILNITGNDALHAYLVENNVSCSQRGGGIRLSYHIYNTEKEIEDIINILKMAPPALRTPKK